MKKIVFLFFMLAAFLLAVSCTLENSLVLCEVGFGKAGRNDKSIYATYQQKVLEDRDDIEIYYNCTYVGSGRSYASKGTDTTQYIRYDGTPIVLSQGEWAFDAILFSRSGYVPSSSRYAIEDGDGGYVDSILVSDKDTYLGQDGTAHAGNDSIFINLDTEYILLHVDQIGGGSNGKLVFSYGASSDYRSVLAQGFPTTGLTNGRTYSVTAMNRFQRIEAKIYRKGDMSTPVLTKSVAASDSYISTHFLDKLGKAFILHLDFTDTTLPEGSYVSIVSVYEDTASRTDTYTYRNSSWTFSSAGSLTKDSGATAIWSEVLAFRIMEGMTTYVNGRAGVCSSPVVPPNGVINVSGDTPDVENIQESTVTGNYIYVIYPNTEDGDYMLNNTDIDPEHGSRIEVAEGVTDFTVDLNGTNVRTDVSEDGEDTTVVVLEEGVTMNLQNNGTGTAVIGGTIGSTNGTDDNEEVYATIELEGGTLNVEASSGTSGSPAATPDIIITGPSRNAGFTGREGAINFSGNGGTLNLDGNVCIGAPIANVDDHTVAPDQTVKGITCFLYDSGTTNKTTTVTEGPRNVEINLTNGASIYANGDANETPAGIFLVGDNNTFTAEDKIKVNLEQSNVVVGVNSGIDSGAGEDYRGYCIRMEDCGKADIEVTIKDSVLVDNWGDAISFKNCSGNIRIVLDNTKIGCSGNGYSAFSFFNCTGTITVELKNNTYVECAGSLGFANWVDCNNQTFYLSGCSGTKSISVDDSSHVWIRTIGYNTGRTTTYSHIYDDNRKNLTVNGSAVTMSNNFYNASWYTYKASKASCSLANLGTVTYSKGL